MERKNYLIEKLSKEEKVYLKQIVVNEKRKYIRNNYKYLYGNIMALYDAENIQSDSVLEAVINECENEIESADEFENIISDSTLYCVVKALSFKEKMVLFCLYKENKGINQIALEMKIDRITVWRIRNRTLDKIIKVLIGGADHV